ncbi:MAG: zinc-dependent alcohol dehydrogenase family protein [Alphaproteobacteria bacterium]
MKAIEVQGAWGVENLAIVDQDKPQAGPGEVLLHIKAAALNYRDLMTVKGMGGVTELPLIPFSDGMAEVEAVGEGVTRVKVGDKVCPLFFPTWLDGEPKIEEVSVALGGTHPGVLREYMVLSEEGVTPIPSHLSDVEAATLPCAGLTAWRAVAEIGKVGPGDIVLVQGTGGVSIFGLQFAKALGAEVIVTSSSDEKLARAKEMGADYLINYKTDENWSAKVMELTGGRGADLIVEVGGGETLGQSIGAAAFAGTIVIIGVLSGYAQNIVVPVVFGKNLTLSGISVGSRAMFERMTACIEENNITPVVDKIYPFSEVKEALTAMENGSHFGKICLEN